MVDYNVQVTETNMAFFLLNIGIKYLINKQTNFPQSAIDYTMYCVDLFFINNANSFPKSFVSKTGIFDFQNLIVIRMKAYIPKQKPSIILK